MANYSKVGNVEEMYGKNVSITTTNAAGYDILQFNKDSGQAFIQSSIIIASPTNDNGVDIGTPSLFVTDADGNPMRLTYTLRPGNGLVLGYTASTQTGILSDDVLSLEIDGDSLKTTATGALYVDGRGLLEESEYLTTSAVNNIDLDIEKITDENQRITLYSDIDEHKRLTINAKNIIDNDTLKVNESKYTTDTAFYRDQKIAVNLTNIIDNDSIITKTINTDNGNKNVLSVDVQNLPAATSTTFGVVKIDNQTVRINDNGVISVETRDLRLVSKDNPKGIVQIQKNNQGQIIVDGNGFLAINPEKMPKCSHVGSTKIGNGFGVVAVDGTTLKANQNGVISINPDGLKESKFVATTGKVGFVRPDNNTITIDSAGIIKINQDGLTVATDTKLGVVKIDNNTIKRNTQGQLYVNGFNDLKNELATCKTTINGLNTIISELKSQISNLEAKITNKSITTLILTDLTNNRINTMTVDVYSKTTTGTKMCSFVNNIFNINYAAGYVFRYRIVGGGTLYKSSSLTINGVAYTENQDIKIASNTVQATLSVNVGATRVISLDDANRIEFLNNSGNIIYSVPLKIKFTKSLTDKYTLMFNDSSQLSFEKIALEQTPDPVATLPQVDSTLTPSTLTPTMTTGLNGVNLTTKSNITLR